MVLDGAQRGEDEILTSFRGACEGKPSGLTRLDMDRQKLELGLDIVMFVVNGEDVKCRDRKVVVDFGIGPQRSTSEGCLNLLPPSNPSSQITLAFA